MGDAYYLGKNVRNFVDLLSFKVVRLIRPTRGQEINIDVFQNPEKYLVRVTIDEIVADTKVSPEAIEMYKQKIKNGEKIAPIIVVKHPKFDVYAVLDGHHRYYAYLELGKKQVNCALAGDFSSVIFYMTEHGYFQPKPLDKEEKEKSGLHLHNFLKDPEKVGKPEKENEARK